MNTIVIVSGYFNPLHKGHLELFENAKKHGDKLWVIVNNDKQRELKGSIAFQDQEERFKIISSLKLIDKAIISIDEDRTVCASLRLLCREAHSDMVLFANGGDQNNESIPEVKTCLALGIKLIDGLGDKIQSSGWLLNNWRKANNESTNGK